MSTPASHAWVIEWFGKVVNNPHLITAHWTPAFVGRQLPESEQEYGTLAERLAAWQRWKSNTAASYRLRNIVTGQIVMLQR